MTENDQDFQRLADILRTEGDPSARENKPNACDTPVEAFGCVVCHDAGFVKLPLTAVGPDRLESRAIPCPACRPVPLTEGIPDRLAGATFESFDLAVNPKMRAAYERCRAVAAGAAWDALLIGDIGTGKSHLAAAALAASVHSKPGYFWPWGQLLRKLRRDLFDEAGPRWDEATALRGWQEGRFLLVLDDVGAEKRTDWSDQTFYAILNARYESRLPTILTTNDPLAIDERLLSRYYEGKVACIGQDVRRLSATRAKVRAGEPPAGASLFESD